MCRELYLHQASGLQERQAILWFVDKLLNLFAQFGQLLPDLEVGDHTLLVGDLDGVILLLILLDFCTENIEKKNEKKNENDWALGLN